MPTSTTAGPLRAAPRRRVAPLGLEPELLESKLRPPWSRPGLVPRAALVRRLLASDAPIVAVVAPAGYGKTTLLGQWMEAGQPRQAWVSLDARDNDPGTLLSYLATALDRLEPMQPTVLRSLTAPGSVDLAAGGHRLAVAASSMRTPFTMALDHVEAIQNPSCRDTIAELALGLPAGSRLGLASRTEPPIPMPQLRARGQVVEVTTDDLAMDELEARQLLDTAQLELDAAAFRELMRRTEGWPVGLYLATLAAGAGNTDGAIAGLGVHGNDRIVADYLRAEVMSALPGPTARFLVRCSVLDSLCGPLCDAVMGATGSQEILEGLEASNLLVVPLDRQRRWYRCHHLLRDLLRDELERSEPELIPRLHDRAAAWFDANERPALALEHAQAAGDADRAARLFVQVAMPTYGAGRVDTVMRWLGWFEVRGLIEEHPQLAVLGALGEAVLGHVATTERWAGAALAAAGGTDRLMPDGSALKGWLAVMEASLFRHGVARMRADAETARARLAPRSSFQATAMFFEALSYHLDDQPAEADERLAHTVERARQLSLPPAIAMALGERTILAIERRDWAAAAELADEGVTLVEELHLGGYLQAIVVYATAARVAAHRGDVLAAKHHAALASRLRPVCTSAVPLSAHFLLQLAHAYLELADPAGARTVLRQVRDILRLRPELGTVARQADELEQMLDTIRVGAVGASSLTAAELRLLPLLATHLSYRDIGERLFLSRNTVKSEAVSLFRKLGVSSRGDAVTKAEEIGLLGR